MVEYFRSMVRLVGRCGSVFQGPVRNVRHEGTRALGVGSEGWQGWTHQWPRHSFALRVTTGSLEGSPKIQGLTSPFSPAGEPPYLSGCTRRVGENLGFHEALLHP